MKPFSTRSSNSSASRSTEPGRCLDRRHQVKHRPLSGRPRLKAQHLYPDGQALTVTVGGSGRSFDPVEAPATAGLFGRRHSGHRYHTSRQIEEVRQQAWRGSSHQASRRPMPKRRHRRNRTEHRIKPLPQLGHTFNDCGPPLKQVIPARGIPRTSGQQGGRLDPTAEQPNHRRQRRPDSPRKTSDPQQPRYLRQRVVTSKQLPDITAAVSRKEPKHEPSCLHGKAVITGFHLMAGSTERLGSFG
jgi:hypothetical protein